MPDEDILDEGSYGLGMALVGNRLCRLAAASGAIKDCL